MSALHGDRSRFHRLRKAKARNRVIRRALAAQAAGVKKAQDQKTAVLVPAA